MWSPSCWLVCLSMYCICSGNNVFHREFVKGLSIIKTFYWGPFAYCGEYTGDQSPHKIKMNLRRQYLRHWMHLFYVVVDECNSPHTRLLVILSGIYLWALKRNEGLSLNLSWIITVAQQSWMSLEDMRDAIVSYCFGPLCVCYWKASTLEFTVAITYTTFFASCRRLWRYWRKYATILWLTLHCATRTPIGNGIKILKKKRNFGQKPFLRTSAIRFLRYKQILHDPFLIVINVFEPHSPGLCAYLISDAWDARRRQTPIHRTLFEKLFSFPG